MSIINLYKVLCQLALTTAAAGLFAVSLFAVFYTAGAISAYMLLAICAPLSFFGLMAACNLE